MAKHENVLYYIIMAIIIVIILIVIHHMFLPKSTSPRINSNQLMHQNIRKNMPKNRPTDFIEVELYLQDNSVSRNKIMSDGLKNKKNVNHLTTLRIYSLSTHSNPFLAFTHDFVIAFYSDIISTKMNKSKSDKMTHYIYNNISSIVSALLSQVSYSNNEILFAFGHNDSYINFCSGSGDEFDRTYVKSVVLQHINISEMAGQSNNYICNE